MSALIHRNQNFVGGRARTWEAHRVRVEEPRGPREELPLNPKHGFYGERIQREIRWTPWSI